MEQPLAHQTLTLNTSRRSGVITAEHSATVGNGSSGSIRYSSSMPINTVENPLMYYYMHYRILMDSKFITNTFLPGCHSLCDAAQKKAR